MWWLLRKFCKKYSIWIASNVLKRCYNVLFVSNCLNLTCSDLPWIIWCKTISLLALQAKRLILSERRLGRAKSFNPLTSNSNNYKKLNNFFHFFSIKNVKLQTNNQFIFANTFFRNSGLLLFLLPTWIPHYTYQNYTFFTLNYQKW